MIIIIKKKTQRESQGEKLEMKEKILLNHVPASFITRIESGFGRHDDMIRVQFSFNDYNCFLHIFSPTFTYVRTFSILLSSHSFSQFLYVSFSLNIPCGES